MPNTDSPKILVVRRDNIGDLVCTTPLLHAIRLRYPAAYVAVLLLTREVSPGEFRSLYLRSLRALRSG